MALGEPLDAETFVVHFELADRSYPGAYAGGFDDGTGAFPRLDASPFTRTRVTRERQDDGTVVTHVSESSVDLGPFNAIIRLVRRLFGRRDD